MDKKEFYEQCAKNSKTTVAYIKKCYLAIACFCGDKGCEGWSLFPRYLKNKPQNDNEVKSNE